MRRQFIYISHPFTGNEEANRESARAITAALSKQCGYSYVFVNPLDMFMGQALLARDDRHILFQAVEVMKRCDGVIFCEGWRKSRGCRIEHRAAYKAGIPIWDNPQSFVEEHRNKRNKVRIDELRDRYHQIFGYADRWDYLIQKAKERMHGNGELESEFSGLAAIESRTAQKSVERSA